MFNTFNKHAKKQSIAVKFACLLFINCKETVLFHSLVCQLKSYCQKRIQMYKIQIFLLSYNLKCFAFCWVTGTHLLCCLCRFPEIYIVFVIFYSHQVWKLSIVQYCQLSKSRYSIVVKFNRLISLFSLYTLSHQSFN